MNDNDLIDQLSEGMRAHTDHTEVPDGFADHARRTARRRSARRAAAAGTPVLAAAGVATVLATSTGSGSSSPHVAQGPTVTVGGGQAHDTAYIVKRVKAKVADANQSGTAIHGSLYGNSDENSDGSLSLGAKYEDEYDYTAPNGAAYDHETYYHSDGSPRLITSNMCSPDGDCIGTIINPVNHTYSQTQTSGSSGSEGPTPNLNSSASEVQQALQSGQVTQMGTTTVNGTPAIALSVTFTAPSGATPTHFTLYVDAHTYQPLRTVTTVLVLDDHNVSVSDWVPATPDNVAQAQANSIPAGYMKVANAIIG